MKCYWCEKWLPLRGQLRLMLNPYQSLGCGRPECEESKRKAAEDMARLRQRMYEL